MPPSRAIPLPPALQYIPPDERTAAVSGASRLRRPARRADELDEDSLDGAGAPSLPNSVWSHVWSNTSAAMQQDLELEDKAVLSATQHDSAALFEDGPGGHEVSAAGRKDGLRHRPSGQKHKGDFENADGDGDSKGKVEDLEDEANSSNISDLKRGKRFKKLTKMLCNVQVCERELSCVQCVQLSLERPLLCSLSSLLRALLSPGHAGYAPLQAAHHLVHRCAASGAHRRLHHHDGAAGQRPGQRCRPQLVRWGAGRRELADSMTLDPSISLHRRI